MNRAFNILGTTAITAAVILTTMPAFASTATFNMAKAGSGMSVDDFDQQVKIFNRADIADLLQARSVSVLRIDTAWNDGGDASKAFKAVEASDQAIHLLREALKADPAAMRLLARNHIAVDQVVDVAPTGNGSVQIYIS
jgi:hypothetical protein